MSILSEPHFRNEAAAYAQVEGSLDGEVLRVGGPQKWVGGPQKYVPVMLQSEDQQIAGCWAERRIAKELAQRLFEPVRLFGRGLWMRDGDGKWNLERFIVESFEALRSETLSESLSRLRAIPAAWSPAIMSSRETRRR